MAIIGESTVCSISTRYSTVIPSSCQSVAFNFIINQVVVFFQTNILCIASSHHISFHCYIHFFFIEK